MLLITLLGGCWRQGNVSHQCGELRKLAGGRQQLNDNAGVCSSNLINQKRQVLTGVFPDTKKQRKNPDPARSRSNQLSSCIGQRRRAKLKVRATHGCLGLP